MWQVQYRMVILKIRMIRIYGSVMKKRQQLIQLEYSTVAGMSEEKERYLWSYSKLQIPEEHFKDEVKPSIW